MRGVDQTAKSWRVLELFIERVIQDTPADAEEAASVQWSAIAPSFAVRRDDIPPSGLKQVVPDATMKRWIEARQTGYRQYCASEGIPPVRFVIRHGRRIHYSFEPIPPDEEAQEALSWRTQGAVIRWRREPIPDSDLSFIGRTLFKANRYEMSGWRMAVHYAYAIGVALTFFLLLACSYLMLIAVQFGPTSGKVGTIASLLTQIALLALFFRYVMVPAARSADMRMHPAPPLLVWFKDGIWVDRINVNLGRDKRDPRYDPAKKAYRQLVRWSADCPICEAPVELKANSPVSKGEFVGCCVESPDEHSFSFDRVTLEGRPLRATPVQ